MKPVVDTNVLIRGKNLDYDEVYIVQEVLDEFKSIESRNKLRNIDYKVRKPGESEIKEVKSKSDEINSPTSNADEKLLALARSINGTLVTDDKPLQNLALHLGVDFEGFLDEATDERYEWKVFCEACGKDSSGDKCPRCGSQVRKKRCRCSST